MTQKTNEVTMVLDGQPVVFVRKDSIPPSSPVIGEKRIIVADKGWVFVGDCEDHDDGSVTIRNARNIRRWGTTSGLGQLVTGPTADTKHDDAKTVRCTPIITFAVVSGW